MNKDVPHPGCTSAVGSGRLSKPGLERPPCATPGDAGLLCRFRPCKNPRWLHAGASNFSLPSASTVQYTVPMKTLYIILALGISLGLGSVLLGQEPKATALDVMAMTAIPDGRYTVTLELKQLDGRAATVELTAKDGSIGSPTDSERLGRVQGRSALIGNGVFLVQLKGKGYMATQYWVFRPDGTAAIKEIPDRGEKQTVVPVGAGK